MKTILTIGSLLLAAFAAWADPGVSGSGEWVIDDGTLIVSNGTVSVDATLSVTTVRINEGATLKIGTGTPFGAEPAVLLFGTLDLNGNSLSVTSFSTRHPDGDVAYAIPGSDKIRYIASSEAMITNSANTVATLTKTGTAFDTGAAIAPNVKVVLKGTKDLQAFGRFGGTGPDEVDVQARELLVMSRPVNLLFVFKEVAGTGDLRKLRLTELMPTHKGVPLTELGYGVTCTMVTPGLASATLGSWVDGNLNSAMYASTSHLVTPESPHVILVTFSGARSYPPVDGYRLGTPLEPAYTPKTWDVYAIRVDDMGATLVDRRVNDPVNRSTINTSSTRDVWSCHLSDNYTFQWPLGDAVGAGTDLALTGKARFTIGDPVSVGAVSGAGKITLDQDSVICPESLADWTGIFSVNEKYGYFGEGPGVLLSSVRGAAEQNFAYTNVNLSVGVAETGSMVKVLYDATTADTYARTRLRDGAGTLGVTVRAQGREQYLAAQGSDYTGPTDVESGTLVVHGKTASEVTCSYIKIAPKKIPEYTGNFWDVYWGMNEFKIYDASGVEVEALANATVTSSTGFSGKNDGSLLCDNNISTRMLPSGGSPENLPFVMIHTVRPVTFATYDWYPTTDGNSTPSPVKYRYPLELEIWVSSDSNNWVLADKRTNAKPSIDSDYLKWQGGANHFSLSFLDQAQGTANLPTLDASVCGTSSDGASFVECVKARYFRFTCFEMFNSWHFRDTKEYTDRGWSMSELSLKRNGEFVDWPTNNANFAVSNGGGLSLWNAGGSVTERIADNIRSKDASGGENRVLYTNALGYVQIDAGELLEFDAYSLWTPPYGSKRLPRGWMLQVSVNGSTFHTIDVHRPAEGDKGRLPSTAYREYGPFSLKNRWPIPGAGNVIGDKSKVTVAKDATLRLDATSEYVGGLAGAGTVNLRGHTLGLLAQDTNTVFSGAVEGAGTLVISGEGEQAFDNAVLSGVSTLKLAGGAMTGSALFGGSDLSLNFAGGALGASLLNVGTLTVTGDVVIRPPAAAIAAKKNWTATITTGTAMDAGTQEGFENAQFIGLPRSMKPSIEVEDTCVTFTIVRSGLVFVIR